MFSDDCYSSVGDVDEIDRLRKANRNLRKKLKAVQAELAALKEKSKK